MPADALQVTCGSCGAGLRPGAAFCGQCYGTLTSSGAVTAVGSPGRFVAQQSLPVQMTFSRWRKSDTTFGPVGRMLWTLLMLLMVSLALFSMDPFALVGVCIVVPLVLRSVWAKGRLT